MPIRHKMVLAFCAATLFVAATAISSPTNPDAVLPEAAQMDLVEVGWQQRNRHKERLIKSNIRRRRVWRRGKKGGKKMKGRLIKSLKKGGKKMKGRLTRRRRYHSRVGRNKSLTRRRRYHSPVWRSKSLTRRRRYHSRV